MWSPGAFNTHCPCLILMLLALGRFGQSSAVGRQVPSGGFNSTSTTSSVAHSTSQHSSTLQAPYEPEVRTSNQLQSNSIFNPGEFEVKPTTSERGTSKPSSTISSGGKSTITPGPASTTYQYPWREQIIPVNTCSFVAPEGDIEYSPCHVSAGQIKLSYFPENNGNTTYPSTYYAADLGVTMTSPLIYMLINTITGDNNCGPLGPTYTNKVVSMNITDVSTLPPYADATAVERIGAQERQLTLSDLLNCPSDTVAPASSILMDPHPILDEYNRCNPRLVFPHQASAIGYPYWVHCGADNYRIGIFDPPGAVPSVNGLLPMTTATPYTSSYESPSALPAVTAAPASTSSATAPTPSTTEVVLVSPIPETEAIQTDLIPFSSIKPASSLSESSIVGPASQLQAQLSQPIDAETGTSTSNLHPQSKSVAPSNAFLIGTNNPVVSINTNGNAAIIIPSSTTEPTPTAIATLNEVQIISAHAGASTLVINSQTLTAGGSVITLAGSNDVATLNPSQGLIVQYASGTVSTYSLPTPMPASAEGTVIATVNGFQISITPGASSIVVGTQTLSVGGPVVTVGSNVVATPGASELVVEYPSGKVSTYALPTGIASGLASGGSGIMETPAVVIEGHTVSIGGPVITLSNNDVVTLGPSGLGIQIPGGGISTVGVPASASPTGTIGLGLGNIIASFAGIGVGMAASSTSTSISTSGFESSVTTETSQAAATPSSSPSMKASTSQTAAVTNPTKTSTQTSHIRTSTKSGTQTLASPTATGAGSRLSLRSQRLGEVVAVMVGLITGL